MDAIALIKHQLAATKRLIQKGLKQYILQYISLKAKLEKLLEKAAKAIAPQPQPVRQRKTLLETAKILASTKLAAQFQTRQDCIDYVLQNFTLITEQLRVIDPECYERIIYVKPKRSRQLRV